MKCVRAILLLVLLATPAAAQQSPWLKETFKSAKLGEDRTIYVATPANYSGTGQRYPVLVLLDANDEPQWAAAVANVAFLSSRGAIPDLLVVGVTNGKDRTHDMTPGATGGTAKNFPTAGGAHAFADLNVSLSHGDCWAAAGVASRTSRRIARTHFIEHHRRRK